VVTDIIAANQSKKLVKELKKLLPAQTRTTITGASYGALLKNLQVYGDGNTQQRAKIYNKIEEEFPGTVTPEEAVETLNILADKVVARTQQMSIKYHYKGIHKILNACFTALAVRDNLNTVDEVIFKNNNPAWNIFNQKLTKLTIQKTQLTGV
jgi:hypothetical protein